ncbi:MAG: ABC transporter permease, partial [Betaproteobacteria bacterium]|nr:ABC transporter permease [Betaproteobacteria bacterium]
MSGLRLPEPSTVRRALLVGALLAWELVPLTGWIPELFLPSLSKTVTVLASDWKVYGAALLVTLGEVALAMLIACGGGIAAGAIVGGLARLRDLLLPVFSS